LGFNGALVFSRVRDTPIDDQSFWPVFEAAEQLRACNYSGSYSPGCSTGSRSNVFVPTDGGLVRHFLGELDDDDRDKIASGNWDRLCAGIRR
jgi:hypothetical protein